MPKIFSRCYHVQNQWLGIQLHLNRYTPNAIGFNLHFIIAIPLLLLLLTGLTGAIILGFGPKAYQLLVPPQPQFTPEVIISPIPSPTPAEIVINVPQEISISRLGIKMAIKEATVSENDWQIYDDAVSWLKTSGTLDGGNIILYGHNTQSLFGNIIQLGFGDEIILAGDGKTQKYQVTQAYQTTRDDLWALQNTNNQLTMYTCSGWFDQYRFFVIAELITP